MRRSSFQWIGVFFAVALTAVVVDGAPDQPAPAAAQDPFIAVVRNARPSVVAIGSYYFSDTPTVRYYGTGFVVGDGRTIVTNQHVIEALRRDQRLDNMRAFFPDGAAVDGRKATIAAEDGFHDLALLSIEGAPATPLKLAAAVEPQQGQAVGIVGYPIGLALGLVPAAHKGVVAAVVPAVLPLPKGSKLTPELADAIKNPYNLYQLDLLVFPGNSGSPLMDAADGRVYGIINKTLATKTREHLLDNPSSIAYAVPARWIHELIVRSRASSPPSATTPAATRPGK